MEEPSFTLLDLRYAVSTTLDFFEYNNIDYSSQLRALAPATEYPVPLGERGVLKIRPFGGGNAASLDYWMKYNKDVPIIESILADSSMGAFSFRCPVELLALGPEYSILRHNTKKNLIHERKISGVFRPFEFKAELQKVSDVLDKIGTSRLEKLLARSQVAGLLRAG